MPRGTHSFYGYSIGDTHRIGNKEDYFLGRFVGDDFADGQFEEKLKKVIALLAGRYSFGSFCHCWSPVADRPYRPRTPDQKLATAIQKAKNNHAKMVLEIHGQNTLFREAFIQEEEGKLRERIAVLTKRYIR